MAHIEIWHRCPVCNRTHKSHGDAIACRNGHPPKAEKWAVGKGGKAVIIFNNYHPDSIHGINGALREADLSDIIAVRKVQLEEMMKGKSND